MYDGLEFDAIIEGVRIAWDEEEQAFRFTCIDPRGTLLVKDCLFSCSASPVVRLLFGEDLRPASRDS